MHAAAAQLDPSLGKLHTKLSGTAFHPWLDVGLAVQVQHDGVAERLRARARFQPDAPLVRHRLIALDRARPEAKDNLVACELKLPPRVARVILGGDPTGGASTYARLLDARRRRSTRWCCPTRRAPSSSSSWRRSRG